MRGHLAALDVDIGDAINVVIAVLQEPPATEIERAKVIGDLYAILSRTELSLREASKISGPLLGDCAKEAEAWDRSIREILGEALYETHLPAFTSIIGKLLAPLKELHQVVKKMEDIRYANSKMRRD
jgi:hypothetical protein